MVSASAKPNPVTHHRYDTSCTSGYLVSEQDKTGLASRLPWKGRMSGPVALLGTVGGIRA